MQTVIGQVVNKTGDNNSRVVPPNKPHPQKPAVPKLPKARALYDYNPQDHDEIGLKEGDIVEILKERKFNQFDNHFKNNQIIGIHDNNFFVLLFIVIHCYKSDTFINPMVVSLVFIDFA